MTLCNDFISGLINLKEFSKGLGVPESTVRTWKRRGELPSFLFKSIGNSIFIKIKAYEKWLEQNE